MGRDWATPGSYLSKGLLNTFKITAERKLPVRQPPKESTLSDMVSQQAQTVKLDEGMQIANSMLNDYGGLFLDDRPDPGYVSQDSNKVSPITRIEKISVA